MTNNEFILSTDLLESNFINIFGKTSSGQVRQKKKKKEKKVR